MTLELVMLWHPTCGACRRTKPIVYAISSMFPNIEFNYWNASNRKYKSFLTNKMGVDVLEEASLSPEEKEEYLKRGITEVSSLPTFFLRDKKRPQDIYEIIVGGVSQNADWKERSNFTKLLIGMLKKYDDIHERRSMIRFTPLEVELREELWGD